MRTCAGSSSKVGKSWMQIPPVFSQSPEIFRGARCAGLARRCCGIVVRIAEACMHRMQLEKRDFYIVSENGTEIKQTTNGVGLNKMFLMCERAAAAPKQHRNLRVSSASGGLAHCACRNHFVTIPLIPSSPVLAATVNFGILLDRALALKTMYELVPLRMGHLSHWLGSRAEVASSWLGTGSNVAVDIAR